MTETICEQVKEESTAFLMKSDLITYLFREIEKKVELKFENEMRKHYLGEQVLVTRDHDLFKNVPSSDSSSTPMVEYNIFKGAINHNVLPNEEFFVSSIEETYDSFSGIHHIYITNKGKLFRMINHTAGPSYSSFKFMKDYKVDITLFIYELFMKISNQQLRNKMGHSSTRTSNISEGFVDYVLTTYKTKPYMLQSTSASFFQDYRIKCDEVATTMKGLELGQKSLDADYIRFKKEKDEFNETKSKYIQMEKLDQMKEDLRLEKIKLQKGRIKLKLEQENLEKRRENGKRSKTIQI